MIWKASASAVVASQFIHADNSRPDGAVDFVAEEDKIDRTILFGYGGGEEYFSLTFVQHPNQLCFSPGGSSGTGYRAHTFSGRPDK